MNRPQRLLLALGLVFGLQISRAAPVQHDLGSNLHYLRLTSLAAEDFTNLTSALAAHPALVLDLRSIPHVEAPATTQLRRSLESPAPDQHTARILLVNSSTAPDLITAVTHPTPGVITLSPTTPSIISDISVPISPEADLAAYQAMTTGTALEKLLNTTPDKTRYDEASLVRDHANGINRAKLEDPETEDDAKANEPDPAKPVEKTLEDLLLQRAVQLHRALLALHKL